MPQLTPQQLELIEQIKQGTHAIEMPDNPTQEDVKLLNEVTGKYKPNANWRYYTLDRIGFDDNDHDLQIIPLSSFNPKVVEVDELLRFVDYKESMVDFSIATETLRTFLLNPELLTQFLNEKGI